MSHTHDVDIDHHVKVYLRVFYALLVLTVVTVGASYLEIGFWGGVILALIIAIIKGSLVACYFMHLISEKKMIYSALALTFFFFIFLFIKVLKNKISSKSKT